MAVANSTKGPINDGLGILIAAGALEMNFRLVKNAGEVDVALKYRPLKIGVFRRHRTTNLTQVLNPGTNVKLRLIAKRWSNCDH